MATPKPLTLLFTPYTNDNSFDENAVIRKETVYFWPSFKEGDIITINTMDTTKSAIQEVKHYKVMRTSFIIGMNSSNTDDSYLGLAIYVKEKQKRQDSGDFEIEII